MNVYHPSKIRNVVLLGHSGSGKTTLAETMLYESGTTKRRGTIEEGNTVSDYSPIEIEKQKSVFSTFTHLDWRGHKINLIDTPGTSDFVGEVISAMNVAEACVFVLDAEHGVEVGTELLWNQARKYNLPSFFVINKVDHSNSDFQKSVDLAKERFGREVVPVQYPYVEKEGFNSIIDVLKMTMYEFPEGGSKPDKLPIPDSHQSQAELMHNELIESIAENDESLMDIYFEKGRLDEEEMIEGLKKAMVNEQIFPLFCVSAERNMGSGRVMGFIDNIAPSPDEANLLKNIEGEPVELDTDKPASTFVFKTMAESHVGDLSFMKVNTGSIKSGMDLMNATTGSSTRLGTLYCMQGGKRVEVPEAMAGDLVSVVKLKDTGVNDTLHAKGFDVQYASIDYPEGTERSALRSVEKGDDEKLGSALNQLRREDPALKIEHSQELRQIIVNAQGEEHLNRLKELLSNRFKIDVEFYEPRIPYRETITKQVKSNYRHKKQTGGAGQFAEVYMLIEPITENIPEPSDITVRDEEVIDLEWGGQLIFRNCIVGGVIDNRFMPAIKKGIMDKMQNGPLSGCRARDIRVSVYDGSMHPVDSNEEAFKTAGLMAFKQGFLDAAPQLLEPIYEVEVTVPEEYMGDIMSDMSTRRGQIQGSDSEGSFSKIKAKVPLAELYKYATNLKSMTQGRGTHTRHFSEYAPVPKDIQERIMKATAELEEA